MKYSIYTPLRAVPGLYTNILISYLDKNENKDKNEYIFLIEKINELETIIKEHNKFSIEDFKNELLKKVSESYSKEDTENWMKYKIKSKNEIRNVNFMLFNNNLKFLKVKLLSTPKPTKTEVIDLSDTKRTEKIIILKQLGILDFLKEKQPFNTSTNALASVLSGITGIKSGTLQSYINPIYSTNVEQKNNPLKNEKSVNKVIQKLISLGYNPTE